MTNVWVSQGLLRGCQKSVRFLMTGLLLLQSACAGFNATDAGASDASRPDAGVADAGKPDAGPTDAGGNVTGGGLCSDGLFFKGFDGPPPLPNLDGVVGVPSSVFVSAFHQTGFAPLEESCVVSAVAGPDGLVSETVTKGGGQQLVVTFTPTKAGTYTLDLAIRDASDKLHIVVTVVAPQSPSLVLPRPCATVVHARSLIGCDEGLFSPNGDLRATLDGGLWLGTGEQLLAWQNGELAIATFDGGGIQFQASVPALRPLSWAIWQNQLAVADTDGGTVFTTSNGALTARNRFSSIPRQLGLTLLADGGALLISNGAVCSTSSGCLSRSFTVVAANEHGVGVLVHDDHFQGTHPGCLGIGPDGGVTSDRWDCPWFSTARLRASGNILIPGYLWVGPGYNDEPVSRRPLALTTRGVRLEDGGAMFLDGSDRGGATEDLVWLSSPTETAIWR